MPTSSIQLLNTIEWAKKFNFGRRSTLGNSLEPATTNANTILQTILGAPFAWRWNRVVTGFICVPGKQDYYLFNWVTSTPVKLGWMTVDNFGNCQTVTVAGTTGLSFPAWNNTLNGNTSDGNATWKNLGKINSAIDISTTYSFGWVETSSIYDSDQAKWIEMESKICLGSDSKQSRPRWISAQGDDGSGNILFRLMASPDQAYPVLITLQQRPVLFTQVSQSWSPIPDEYSHIYNWGFLSLFWLFSDDPRFPIANQKFVTQLLAASEGLTDTERNIWLGNWQFITGQPISDAMREQQGHQARGA